MKIQTLLLAIALALPVAFSSLLTSATVAVTAGPTSLVPDPIVAKVSSPSIPLFEFTLAYDAGETLLSVAAIVNQNSTTTVSGTDLADVSVYKDNGNGSFDSSTDALIGSQTSVLIASSTTVSITTSTPATGKFFVALSTGASWSDASPPDSIKVTLPADQIISSAGVVSSSSVTTNSITADTTTPSLVSAVAKNTGGTSAKEAGDSVELTFSEPTNKVAVTAASIGSVFIVSNGHSFLDGSGALGSTSWNTSGATLTLTLSASSSLPTVAVGDAVTVVTPSSITDLAGNKATGSRTITGSFSTTTEDVIEEGRGNCSNGLKNGRLYQVAGSDTVYLAAACRLKPFRGAAVFHAQGRKFKDIIVLPALPANTTISSNPVLPAAGNLVKGKNATVWFVTHNQHRRGFVSAPAFLRLGFAFGKVKAISDEDLTLLPVDSPIDESAGHPDGSLAKCGNSPTVFAVIGGQKFPFRTAEAFLSRGHSWEQISTVDCGRFAYVQGAPVEE